MGSPAWFTIYINRFQIGLLLHITKYNNGFNIVLHLPFITFCINTDNPKNGSNKEIFCFVNYIN